MDDMAEMDYWNDGWEQGQIPPNFTSTAPSTNELNGVASAGSSTMNAGHSTTTKKATTSIAKTPKSSSSVDIFAFKGDHNFPENKQPVIITSADHPTSTLDLHGHNYDMPWSSIGTAITFWIIVSLIGVIILSRLGRGKLKRN